MAGNTTRISDAEWKVMQVVWEKHPITAAEILAALSGDVPWKDRTVKTLINRLLNKGVLGYEKQGKAYIYHPLVSREASIGWETQGFLDRVFGGSLKPMLAHFVDQEALSKEDVRELIDYLEDRMPDE